MADIDCLFPLLGGVQVELPLQWVLQLKRAINLTPLSAVVLKASLSIAKSVV
jgi:hypothetical protein